MLSDIQTLQVMLSALGGAIFSAVLGWGESGEPFNARKFAMSILRAIVAGLGIGITAYYGLEATTLTSTIITCAVVFLAGMGIDAGGNRLSGTITAKATSTTTSPIAPSAPATGAGVHILPPQAVGAVATTLDTLNEKAALLEQRMQSIVALQEKLKQTSPT